MAAVQTTALIDTQRTAELGAPDIDRPSRVSPTTNRMRSTTFWNFRYAETGLPNIVRPPAMRSGRSPDRRTGGLPALRAFAPRPPSVPRRPSLSPLALAQLLLLLEHLGHLGLQVAEVRGLEDLADLDL